MNDSEGQRSLACCKPAVNIGWPFFTTEPRAGTKEKMTNFAEGKFDHWPIKRTPAEWFRLFGWRELRSSGRVRLPGWPFAGLVERETELFCSIYECWVSWPLILIGGDSFFPLWSFIISRRSGGAELLQAPRLGSGLNGFLSAHNPAKDWLVSRPTDGSNVGHFQQLIQPINQLGSCCWIYWPINYVIRKLTAEIDGRGL